MEFRLVEILLFGALFCFSPSFCHKKKSKSGFNFDSILSGMDGSEKEIFKEELEKEVKKFHVPSTSHHKKSNVPKRRPHKSGGKPSSSKPLSPGVCDPICEHQCVHGCDFRCCIPRYQVTHNIPRPLPHVTLPGACSPTCSPTCFPECTSSCCAGGPGGMFQSSAALISLYPPVCQPPCSASCFPQCSQNCCNPGRPSFMEPNVNMYAPGAPQFLPPPLPPPPRPRPLPRRRPFRFYRPSLATPLQQSLMQPNMEIMMPQMLGGEPIVNIPDTITQGFTHCGGSCPVSCVPTCLSTCCMESQQQQRQQQQQQQSETIRMETAAMQAPPNMGISNPESSSVMQAQQLPVIQARDQTQVSQPLSPIVAAAQPSIMTHISTPIAPIAPAPAPVKLEPQAQLTCHSSCPDMCLPDCSDSCCNPGPRHAEIDKKSKISKIAMQLAMLKKKH